MARKRMTALAQAISLCNELNDGDKQTLVDLLRTGKSQPSRNGTRTAKIAGGNDAMKRVKKATGASTGEALIALSEAANDEETAIQLLQGSRKVHRLNAEKGQHLESKQ